MKDHEFIDFKSKIERYQNYLDFKSRIKRFLETSDNSISLNNNDMCITLCKGSHAYDYIKKALEEEIQLLEKQMEEL